MADVALLLPGWGTSPNRFARIREHLADQRVCSLDHVVHPDALIDVLARRTRRRAEELAADGTRVHLVGHSLGGLVAAWAATEDLRGTIASVTTINTPWQGTWLAWTGTGELAAQLRWGSGAITCLQERLRRHLDEPTGPSWLVVGTAGDLGTPLTTALRPGTSAPRLQRRIVPAFGHSTSLLRPAMARAVAEHVVGVAENDDTRPDGPRVRQVSRGGGEGI